MKTYKSILRIIAAAVLLTASVSSYAQTELLAEFLGGSGGGVPSLRLPSVTGVVAGLNFSGDKDSPMNQYHVGVATRMGLPLGFALQPAILYNVKGSTIKGAVKGADLSTSVGYLEVPVQLQWGIRIKKFRPFIFGEPFVGYGVNAKNVLHYQDAIMGVVEEVLTDTGKVEEIKGDLTNRLEYGIGAGAGLEYGPLQINAKFFWNVGNLYSEEGELGSMEDIKNTLLSALKDTKSISGCSISLVILF